MTLAAEYHAKLLVGDVNMSLMAKTIWHIPHNKSYILCILNQQAKNLSTPAMSRHKFAP